MTERETARLDGVAETLLITLYLRAVDARRRRPVLGDPYAVGLVERIVHDFSAYDRGRANAVVVAARARGLDRWTARFLDEHPDGQVLHLGCGLDSRPLRLSRPPGARWVDVDRPEVAALRRRVYDLPADVEVVGASVTDPDWWDDVDGDRPTLIVAEGLLMYLEPDDVTALVRRAREHLGSAEIVFDGVAGWLVGLSRRAASLRRAGIRFTWALDDLPGTRVLEDRSLMTLLASDSALAAPLRAVYGLLARVPPMRDALRLRRLAL